MDSRGATLDLMLNHKRNSAAAKRFLKKVLSNYKYSAPRAINTDKNPTYGLAELKASNHVPKGLEHR